ncbi:MAG: FAD-dependent oxidoreductase [Thermodesulfobacteriota bacterium]
MILKSVEIAVVGGGVIGSAICYYLAKEGYDVALFERGGLVDGASGACGGYVGLQTKGLEYKLSLAVKSRGIFRTLEEELEEDIECRESPGMIIAENDEEVEYISTLTRQLKEKGINIELLDRRQVRKQQPILNESVKQATLCLDDCEVNPIKLTLALAAGAERNGAKIFTHTQIKDIGLTRNRVSAIITDRGKINTGIVINAGGIWAPQIGNMVGLKIPIIPRRGILIVSEPMAPLVNGHIIAARSSVAKLSSPSGHTTERATPSFGGGISIAQHENGNIVCGTTREFVGYDKSTTFRGISFIVGELLRIFPSLENMRIIRTFAGLRPYTPDGLPIVGNISGIDGFIVAAGHEGDGIALAPITGKLVAALISGDEIPEMLAPLNLTRFQEIK